MRLPSRRRHRRAASTTAESLAAQRHDGHGGSSPGRPRPRPTARWLTAVGTAALALTTLATGGASGAVAAAPEAVTTGPSAEGLSAGAQSVGKQPVGTPSAGNQSAGNQSAGNQSAGNQSAGNQSAGNPFAGATTYVNPNSPASLAAAAEPDPERARQLRRVASGGNGEWYGDWSPTHMVTRSVSDRIARIRATGALPVFVVYHIPLRDCGSYSAGGATSPQAYRDWIDAFATGLGSHRAVVVLEPDSLADMGCLSYPDQEIRYSLLRYALARFNASPAVTTYLDGGHSAWLPASTMAYRLNRANVAEARGFAVNVSNFRTTSDEVAYGRDIASRTGGKNFVVDTSRNGLGPAGGTGGWCNPAGRALGPRPLSTVPHPQVDALLWVKVPGQSDGGCGRGEPAPGTFWPDYAIGLASRAAW